MAEKRKKVWIDRLQTLLSVRLALYFISFQVTVWLLFAIERSMTEGLEYLFGAGAGFVSFSIITGIAVVMALMFIWDVVKQMHRLVGPLVRFRRVINSIAAGEEVALITLRNGDHLQDLKDDFNEMLKSLEQRGAVVIRTPGARQNEKQTTAV